MAHVNPHNGKPWSQSPEYIFAFGTQNEAMDGNALTSRVQHSTWLLSMPTVLADLTKEAPKPYAEKAQKSGKKLIMQEWGTCYYDTRNNN
ncbi:hypothetical protein D0868_01467 [Hortaea werneckii]|uniref:Uncharacterized protein n=1 Tax=Hortaea werneckii TaxID=91943 RepID=A0A3M7AZ11_HORWE|nr:hypothetical protein D0868_01467 [Hortaea werneckii]RMY32765.1 hypothetical protein D0866_06378 [Hortaea werneckii]